MGRAEGGGVRVRGASIVIDFRYRGVRCRETLSVEPTKSNLLYARRLRDTILLEIERGTFDYSAHFPDSKKVVLFGGAKAQPFTVAAALDQYLAHVEKTKEASTVRTYRRIIESHLIPQFGAKQLREVTTASVKAWIGALDCGPKRINNLLIPLRSIFHDAYLDGLIERNPMERIENLRVVTQDPDPFTPDEVAAILQHLPDQAANMIQFAVWTGLRTSELVALRWEHVDWGQGIALIRETRTAADTRAKKRGKTAAAMRSILLLPPAKEALEKQKQHSLLGNAEIFLNPQTGKPWVSDSQFRDVFWVRALRKAGVRYRNPYQTRHTYASMMLTAGEDPTWIAGQMGHKDWGMIRRVYARWLPSINPTAGSKIMALWSQFGHTKKAADK